MGALRRRGTTALAAGNHGVGGRCAEPKNSMLHTVSPRACGSPPHIGGIVFHAHHYPFAPMLDVAWYARLHIGATAKLDKGIRG